MIRWRTLFHELPEPWLVMVCGLVGVGKSTIAQEIARSLAAKHLNTDRIGYQFFGEQRRYDEAYYARVYGHMKAETREARKNNEPIVLDGTFLKTDVRRSFIDEFSGDAFIWLVYVICDEPVVQARLEQRAHSALAHRDYSEASFDTYLMMKEKLAQNHQYSDPRAENISCITLDTTLLPWRIVEKRIVPRVALRAPSSQNPRGAALP